MRQYHPLVLVAGGDETAETGGNMSTYVDRFAAHQRYRNLSTATIRRRKNTLEHFEKFIWPTDLRDAKPDDLEQFLSCKHAARTKHAYRSDLRVFYKWLVDKEILERSPAERIASVKVPKSLPRPIAVADALGALTHGRRQVRRMVGLALFAGLRCHEIAQLDAEDVWLHVNPPMVVVRHGKGGKDRSVPMHPMLAELLADLPSSGPVFPGQRGHRTMQPYSVSKAIAAHLERSGVFATPHQLRHTFGSELARVSGGNLVLVAEFMGHESATTTMGYVRLAVGNGGQVVGTMYGPTAA